MKQKAIFLDRDGTINVDKDYIFRIEDFEFLPGVIDALRMAQNNGYLLIIITNQSGIARGYYNEEDFVKLNTWMLGMLKNQGITIAATYYCPHHPQAMISKYRVNCNCRKPQLGMFEKAVDQYDLDLRYCYAIGDKIRDCSICQTTDCQGYLIGNKEKREIIDDVKLGKVRNVKYALDLKESIVEIINENNKKTMC